MESLILTSFQEAQRLGHPWVGQEHLLLAIADDSSHSKGQRARRACGLDEATVRELVETTRYHPDPGRLAPGERPQPNPHFYQLCGRAEGFAISAGRQEPLPEHILLAMLWDAD